MTVERGSVVLAAVDGGAASRSVIRVAGDVCEMSEGSHVEALYVAQPGSPPPRAVASDAGVALRELDGDAVEILLDQAGRPDVRAVAVGVRNPEGPLPAGHVALALATQAAVPLVLVPPVLQGHRPLRTMLVPLDGTPEASAAVTAAIDLALGADKDVVVLHVHELGDLPMVTDQPQHEAEAWARSFLHRHCSRPRDVRLEVRVGRADEQVETVADEAGADIILLGWSQRLDQGRAAVVRSALGQTGVPVMLIPAAHRRHRVVLRSPVPSGA